MNKSEIIRKSEALLEKSISLSSSGILQSKRLTPFGTRVDNNIFFTLSAYWLIRDLNLAVNSYLLDVCSSHIKNYGNEKRPHTYNFWTTKPVDQFPNSVILRRLKHFWIPDDLDCTVLSYLILDPAPFKTLEKELSKKMSNDGIEIGGVSFKKGFYSTWLGVNMPHEFDVCVLCNHLTVSMEKNGKLAQNDYANVDSVEQVVKHNLWVNHPFEVSPNYQKSPVIAFHLARCVNALPELAHLKVKLQNGIQRCIDSSKSMEQLVLFKLAMQYLGKTETIEISPSELDQFIYGFPFFYAPMLASSRNKSLLSMKQKSIFNIPFVCPGFNAALLLKLFHSE